MGKIGVLFLQEFSDEKTEGYQLSIDLRGLPGSESSLMQGKELKQPAYIQ